MIGAEDREPGKPQPSGVSPRAIEVNTTETRERWPMDLATATRIAFENSENFRLIQLGVFSLNAAFFPLNTEGPITIARLNTETSDAKFKADAMALVRSVEQQYWNLAQADVAFESTEQAISVTRELLGKVTDKLTLAHCDPAVAEAAEAAQRLEQFHADLAARKADVVSAERALRKVLGLPQEDNRRIVPTTKPTEELLSFDWDTCVDELLREQPDNVHQQALVRLAELYLLTARNQLIPLLDNQTLRQLKGLGRLLDSSEAVVLGKFLKALGPLTLARECVEGIDLSGNTYIDSLIWQRGLTHQAPMGTGRDLLWNTRQAQYTLLRARARQRQVFDQTTRSLARSFLEVDSSYERYAAARRLKAAAGKRLEAQRGFYDNGRITLDRVLDAVEQSALAIATEARHKAAYIVSLADLSAAKGTLLADRNIVVAEGPKRVHPLRISQTKTARSFSVIASLEATDTVSVGGGTMLSESAEPAIAKPHMTTPSKADDQAKRASFEPNQNREAPGKPKTWSFSISIGWDKPVQIKGTISVEDPTVGR
jgi:outer membrane protein TolC